MGRYGRKLSTSRGALPRLCPQLADAHRKREARGLDQIVSRPMEALSFKVVRTKSHDGVIEGHLEIEGQLI
jgi:hypothetical protein